MDPLGGLKKQCAASKMSSDEGLVEVHDSEQKCWYQAQVVDVSKDKIQVSFSVQGGKTNQSWMSWNVVREVPRASSFDLKEARAATHSSMQSQYVLRTRS